MLVIKVLKHFCAFELFYGVVFPFSFSSLIHRSDFGVFLLSVS